MQTIVIEFSGYRGGVGVLRGLDGVVAAEPGRVRVRVRAARSDEVLRRLLAAGEGVHIERVSAVSGNATSVAEAGDQAEAMGGDGAGGAGD